MSEILKRLEEEEKEAEKLLYEGEEEDATATQERDTESDSGPEETEVESTSQPSEEKKERVSWKKRYSSYKASTDQTIHQLRQENAAVRDKNDDLQRRVSELTSKVVELQKASAQNVDPLEGVLGEEEAELLGPEAVAVLKKFAAKMMDSTKENPQVEELNQELAELRAEREKERKRQEEVAAQQNLLQFKERLMNAVPDFDELDQDEKFGEYLNDLDEASGLPRVQLYKTAIQGRDVLGVARFYNDFRKTKPKTREEKLDEEVVPEGRAVDLSSPIDDKYSKKERFTVAEYEKFMDDVTKGAYKGREDEARKIEKRFDKAFMEGRVDGVE